MEKRILIFTNHFNPEYFKINDIVNWIKENGNQVTVVTGNPNYPKGKIYPGYSVLGSREKTDNLSVYRLPLIPRGNGSKIRLIFNYLSYFLSSFIFTLLILLPKKKFDKVFVHHTSPPFIFLPALFYKWIKRSELILWDLDMWPQTLEATGVIKSQRSLTILETIFERLYKEFDFILLGSKHFEEIASKRVAPLAIKYFPNWADSIFETYNPKNRNIDFSKKITITYSGNIGEAQNLEKLIEAVTLTTNKKIEVRMIGNGRNKEALEKLVLAKKVSQKIKFFDSVNSSELIHYFETSDFLFLSLKESPIFSKTVPAKLQTYLAVGIPIIGLISGESKAIIEKNNVGFCAKAGDISGLVQILNSLTNLNDHEYQLMKNNALRVYKTNYSSNQRRKELIKLLS